MRLYISGPMSGMPLYNMAAFEEAAQTLRDEGIDVISPIELDRADGHSIGEDLSAKYWKFLSRDVRVIGESNLDGIIVLKGWSRSKGAKLEVFQALLMNLSVYHYETRVLIKRETIMRILAGSILEGTC